MQDTLVARLGKLEQFKESGSKLGVSLDERELSDAEVRILTEFYEEDQLASDVSKGQTPYTQLVEPIEKRYGSLWRRIWYPKKDKAFDDEVERVLGSMNNVDYEHYGNPTLFTTSGRRSEVWDIDKGALMGGTIFAAFMGVIAYGMPEALRDESVYVQAFLKSSPVIALAMAYALGKVLLNSDMNRYLNHLKEYAQEIDEFLRQHPL